MEILLYILLTLMLAAVAMLTVMLVRQSKAEERIVDRLMEELEDDQRELRMELTDSVHKNVGNLGSLIAENQQSAYRAQSESLSQLRRVHFFIINKTFCKCRCINYSACVCKIIQRCFLQKSLIRNLFIGQDIGRCIIRYHLPVCNYNRTIRIFEHQMHVMRDHNDRDTGFFIDPANKFHDFRIMTIILSRCRFIQDHDLRLHDKDRCDRHTLFLSERQG